MGSPLGGDDKDAISEINVTPFVDIILVVLIIFMVTTPIIMKPSINVNLPKAKSGDSTETSKLSITIDSTGLVYLNGQKSTQEELREHVAQVAKTNPEQQAIISADAGVAHGTVVSILDLVKAAGLHKFAISIDRK